MDSISKILKKMKDSPANIRFSDLKSVCKHYFGDERINGSHHYYKTPWEGDPRICIQEKNGKAKPYQVRDVLKAVELVEITKSDENE